MATILKKWWRSKAIWSLPTLVVVLGMILAFGVHGPSASPAEAALINGKVCNGSSLTIALTVVQDGQFQLMMLSPGNCTDGNVDAEAIWGQLCRKEGCYYQLWKVGAGEFKVVNYAISPVPSILSTLKIQGNRFGSDWLSSIPSEWSSTQPSGDQIPYELVR